MHGQFLCAESHSLAGDFQRDAVGFEKNAARAYACGVVFGGTLTFTHTDTQTLGGHGAVGEDTDPELTLTLHLTGDSLTGSLNLAGGDPVLVQRFQCERAECDFRTTLGDAFHSALLRPSVFEFFRL